ncbi:MAG: hypothetical protein WCH01_16590 [Methylococcaceae bacterium]
MGHNPGLRHGCSRNAAESLIDVDNPAASSSDHVTFVCANEETYGELDALEFFFGTNII